MLGDLTCTCADCGRPLGDAEFRLAMETTGGERRAYECRCGSVTVTVARRR